MLLPDLSPADRALVYGIVGGMPLYLGWRQQDRSVTDNLLRLVAAPGSPLLTEARLIMETELRSDQGGAVIEAIGAGKTRYNEIEGTVGFPPARALDRLQEARRARDRARR